MSLYTQRVELRKRASQARRRFKDRRLARHEAQLFEAFQALQLRDGAALLDAHFRTWSQPDHINRPGFTACLELMEDRPQLIIETGTSAWGTDSTRLWDAYVKTFGGEFWSVDLSPAPRMRLVDQVGPHTHLVVEDSVRFLTDFTASHRDVILGMCYLDSWDLDWSDPDPAAEHGLAEFHAIRPLLGRGSVLVIDDSPGTMAWVPQDKQDSADRYLRERGYLPGKGALVHRELANDPRVRIVWHGYNAVYHFED